MPGVDHTRVQEVNGLFHRIFFKQKMNWRKIHCTKAVSHGMGEGLCLKYTFFKCSSLCYVYFCQSHIHPPVYARHLRSCNAPHPRPNMNTLAVYGNFNRGMFRTNTWEPRGQPQAPYQCKKVSVLQTSFCVSTCI